MYQFRCDSLKPQDLFLQGIGSKERVINQVEDELTTHEIKVRKGEFNYILQEDTFIDLDTNIPFMFSDHNEEERLMKDQEISSHNFEYVKKMYKDSSRFLSTYSHHHLIFSHTKKDTLLWKNITNKENKQEVIE